MSQNRGLPHQVLAAVKLAVTRGPVQRREPMLVRDVDILLQLHVFARDLATTRLCVEAAIWLWHLRNSRLRITYSQ